MGQYLDASARCLHCDDYRGNRRESMTPGVERWYFISHADGRTTGPFCCRSCRRTFAALPEAAKLSKLFGFTFRGERLQRNVFEKAVTLPDSRGTVEFIPHCEPQGDGWYRLTLTERPTGGAQ